jgi:hypothetical protein
MGKMVDKLVTAMDNALADGGFTYSFDKTEGLSKGMLLMIDNRKVIRALLAAMREPTAAMCSQGSAHIRCADDVDPTSSEQAGDAWRAMIDAALTA